MTRISNDSAAADSANDKLIDDVTRSEYKYGFTQTEQRLSRKKCKRC